MYLIEFKSQMQYIGLFDFTDFLINLTDNMVKLVPMSHYFENDITPITESVIYGVKISYLWKS
jgi:hypothetical protein